MKSTLRYMVTGAALTAALGTSLQAQTRTSELRCGNSLRYRSNFRLNGAQQYLAQAEGTQYLPDRQRHIASGLRVLGEAVQAGGADQGTMWFLYARLYALQGDLRGADSAFSRAASAFSSDQDCVREIGRLRFNLSVPLINGGQEQMRAENWDSALTLLRAAVMIHPTSAPALMNLAGTFLRTDRFDSAGVYYLRAARAASDPQQEEMRTNAAFNAGRVFERANRLAAAESAYRFLLELRPRDATAKVALAGVLRRQGRGAEATALIDSMIANPQHLSSFELFEIGTGLFRDSAFGRAARALTAGLERNPWYRDAHYNLTNVYLAAGDTARLLEAARRLVQIDPNNRMSLRLLASAYQTVTAGLLVRARRIQAVVDSFRTLRRPLPPAWRDSVDRIRPVLTAWQDSVVQTLTRADSLLPWELRIDEFRRGDSTVTIHGIIANLRNREAPPFVLSLDIMGGSNGDSVLTTHRLEVPALNQRGSPGAVYDFRVEINARGAVAYRYRE